MKKASTTCQRGFTLIELLIVVAIIGIIAAILIPNLIDSLQKAKQKSTVGDIKNIGTAWMSWVTDQISAGAAGQNVAKQLNWTGDLGNPVSFAQLSTILEGNGDQFYLQKLPENDGWGHPLEFRAVFDPATASTFSNLIRSSRAIGIRSTGRSGLADGNVYTNGIFPSATYNCDIVWSDGYFVRIPGGVNASSSSAPSKKSQKAPDC